MAENTTIMTTNESREPLLDKSVAPEMEGKGKGKRDKGKRKLRSLNTYEQPRGGDDIKEKASSEWKDDTPATFNNDFMQPDAGSDAYLSAVIRSYELDALL